MPGSLALIAGLVLLGAAFVLAGEWLKLRNQIDETSRVLNRSRAAIAETERVRLARDEVIGSAGDDVIRRSYDVIAGVPFALIEASPMPKDTVRVLRDAHDAAINGVYSTIWGIDRTVGLGILDKLTGNPGKTAPQPPRIVPEAPGHPRALRPHSYGDSGHNAEARRNFKGTRDQNHVDKGL